MSIKSRVRNIIHSESLGVCALCAKDIGADGEIAHIIAEKYDGPRGNYSLALESKNNPENLIYLCVSCHREKIDKYPDDYSVEMLMQVKTRMKNIRKKFNNGEMNYFTLLFHGVSPEQIFHIFSNACRGIQIHLSESDEDKLSFFQTNIDSVLVPATSQNDIECIKKCIHLLFDAFDKEGEEFQFSPYERKNRVMFYNENNPSTFHRRDEFWQLYFLIEESCIQACYAIQNLQKVSVNNMHITKRRSQ